MKKIWLRAKTRKPRLPVCVSTTQSRRIFRNHIWVHSRVIAEYTELLLLAPRRSNLRSRIHNILVERNRLYRFLHTRYAHYLHGNYVIRRKQQREKLMSYNLYEPNKDIRVNWFLSRTLRFTLYRRLTLGIRTTIVHHVSETFCGLARSTASALHMYSRRSVQPTGKCS